MREKPVSPSALSLPPPQDAADCDVVSGRFAVVIDAAAADCAKFTLKSEGGEGHPMSDPHKTYWASQRATATLTCGVWLILLCSLVSVTLLNFVVIDFNSCAILRESFFDLRALWMEYLRRN